MEEKTLNIKEKLMKIQQELIAPKSLYNDFGKYKYRSTEMVLKSVKPLLDAYGCFIVLLDEIVYIGTRYYVKATARIQDTGSDFIGVSAFAREPDQQKGQNESQITGAASSYARKYALSGLLAIDDSKDADSIKPTKEKPSTVITGAQMAEIKSILEKINGLKTVEEANTLKEELNETKKTLQPVQIAVLRNAFSEKTKELNK